MIQIKDNKLQAELLSRDGILSERMVNNYNYIDFKNNFEEIVDILETNILVHSLYEEYLKYNITEDLNFVIVSNDFENITINTSFITNSDKSILTLDRNAYDTFVELCFMLLNCVKKSFDKLDEVEKFILKSLEFDIPKLTDEEVMDRLMLYKNGYYLCKKSAYIKMGLQLNIHKVKCGNNEEYLKELFSTSYIGMVGNK